MLILDFGLKVQSITGGDIPVQESEAVVQIGTTNRNQKIIYVGTQPSLYFFMQLAHGKSAAHV